MKNPPSFQFYPEAFLSDLNVLAMTDKEVGRYIKLLCHCWIEDGLPAKGSRVVDLYLKNSPAILKCFFEKDGKYRQKRIDEEREKQIRWREKCSLGGKKSRKNKGINKGSIRVEQVKSNTLPSSLYSLPSTLEEKKQSPTEIVVPVTAAPKPKHRTVYPITLDYERGEWIGITEDKKKFWKTTFPAVDIEPTLKEILAYWIERPNNRRLNWGATILNRLKFIQERSSPSKTYPSAGQGKDIYAGLRAFAEKQEGKNNEPRT
jgi:uncharacterized protein YdaU (DUF1376 family)